MWEHDAVVRSSNLLFAHGGWLCAGLIPLRHLPGLYCVRTKHCSMKETNARLLMYVQYSTYYRRGCSDASGFHD